MSTETTKSRSAPYSAAEIDALKAHFSAFLARSVEMQQTCFLEMDVATAVVIIAQLQLALRHPQNTGPASQISRQFAEALIEQIAPDDAEARRLLEMGFDPQYDEETTPNADTV